MKKIILTTAILSAFLISCNETKNKQENTETKVETTEGIQEQNNLKALSNQEKVSETHSLNNDWVNEIKLEDNSKWQANLDTTEGVDKMRGLLKASEPKTITDYHALASKLNEEKNVVVKKCTMEGPSHDNLHVFLHPLIEKIEALGKVTTVIEGLEVTASIKENLDAYYTYFK